MVQEYPYRLCVGVVLLNDYGEVFIARRCDFVDAWQMPQGGIEEGETPLQAALRELQEEIGTNHVKVLSQLQTPFYYEFPTPQKYPEGKTWKGQKQYWIIAQLLDKDENINLSYDSSTEFDAWSWTDPEDVIDKVIWFKKDVYRAVFTSDEYLRQTHSIPSGNTLQLPHHTKRQSSVSS